MSTRLEKRKLVYELARAFGTICIPITVNRPSGEGPVKPGAVEGAPATGATGDPPTAPMAPTVGTADGAAITFVGAATTLPVALKS